MVLLQHKLSVKLSQRQILTPGLVQMVSVLALNKLELKDMINAEMVENPVLEELEESVPLIDEVGRKEEDRDRATAKTSTEEAPITAEKKDPFEEIDFGSFFQDYLDPGYRTRGEMEEIERPSFENFLSKPTTLTDHLSWQLGALSLRREVREAAEQILGNLNEDGYLIASDEEMLGVALARHPGGRCRSRQKHCHGSRSPGFGRSLLRSRRQPTKPTKIRARRSSLTVYLTPQTLAQRVYPARMVPPTIPLCSRMRSPRHSFLRKVLSIRPMELQLPLWPPLLRQGLHLPPPLLFLLHARFSPLDFLLQICMKPWRWFVNSIRPA